MVWQICYPNPEATFFMRSKVKWVISIIIEITNDGDPSLCIEKMSALSQQEFIWLFGQSFRDSVLRDSSVKVRKIDKS